MDSQDLGELLAIFVGNAVGLVLCTYVSGRLLSETRLPRGKVVLAALFLGHLAANLLRMLAGPDSKWSAVGFTISRVVGLPILGFWISHRVWRWRAERPSPGGDPKSSDDSGTTGEAAAAEPQSDSDDR